MWPPPRWFAPVVTCLLVAARLVGAQLNTLGAPACVLDGDWTMVSADLSGPLTGCSSLDIVGHTLTVDGTFSGDLIMPVSLISITDSAPGSVTGTFSIQNDFAGSKLDFNQVATLDLDLRIEDLNQMPNLLTLSFANTQYFQRIEFCSSIYSIFTGNPLPTTVTNWDFSALATVQGGMFMTSLDLSSVTTGPLFPNADFINCMIVDYVIGDLTLPTLTGANEIQLNHVTLTVPTLLIGASDISHFQLSYVGGVYTLSLPSLQHSNTRFNLDTVPELEVLNLPVFSYTPHFDLGLLPNIAVYNIPSLTNCDDIKLSTGNASIFFFPNIQSSNTISLGLNSNFRGISFAALTAPIALSIGTDFSCTPSINLTIDTTMLSSLNMGSVYFHNLTLAGTGLAQGLAIYAGAVIEYLTLRDVSSLQGVSPLFQSLKLSTSSVVNVAAPNLVSVVNLILTDNAPLATFYAPKLSQAAGYSLHRNPVLTQFCVPPINNLTAVINGAQIDTVPQLSAAFLSFIFGGLVPPVNNLSSVCANVTVDCSATPVSLGQMCPGYACPPPPSPPPPPAAPPPPPSVTSGSSSPPPPPSTGSTSGAPPPAPATTPPTDEGTLNGEPCPVGGVCPGGNKIYPQPGYWNTGVDSGFVEVCEEPAEVRCTGGTNSTCGDGYSGVLCGNCQAGFYLRGSECVLCGDYSNEGTLYGITGALFFFMALGHVTLNDLWLDRLISVFKFLQMLRVAGTKTGFNLPTGMKQINDNLALITFDYSFLKPECSGSSVTTSSFDTLFWGNAVVIACLVFPPLLVQSLLAAFQRSKRDFWIARMCRTTLVYVVLVYFVITTRAVQSTTCIQVGPLRVFKVSLADCHTTAVAGVGAFALVAFVAAVPVVFAVVLTWLHRSGRLEKERPLDRFAYFHHGLRLNWFRFVFEIVQLMQLLLLAIAWNVFPNNASPYAFSVAIYAIMLLVTASWRPYATLRRNVVGVFSVGVGFVSSVANLATLSTIHNQAAALPVVIVMAIVTVGITVAVFLVERRAALVSGGSGDGKKDDKSLDSGSSLSNAKELESKGSSSASSEEAELSMRTSGSSSGDASS